jgi:hypothetical protein
MTKRGINIFDKIGSLIPGFKGYSNRSEMRSSDTLLRNEVSSLIQQSELIVIEIQKDLISSGEIQESVSWEKNRKSLNTLYSEIKYCVYGETSFFSNKQIKEEELLLIYQFDEKMLELAKSMYEEIKIIKVNYKLQIPIKIEEMRNIKEARTNFINKNK